MRFLLPYLEGRAWLAETAGVITEAPDEDTRRHYLRCYRRAIPRLIFTIWSEHLRELHNRNRGCEVTAKTTKPANSNNPAGFQPTDAPWWRLVFLLVDGDDDQWRRGLMLIVLAGMFLVGGLVVLLFFASWAGGAGGALAAGLLTTLFVDRRHRSRSGRR